jgi:hypothetical protein
MPQAATKQCLPQKQRAKCTKAVTRYHARTKSRTQGKHPTPGSHVLPPGKYIPLSNFQPTQHGGKAAAAAAVAPEQRRNAHTLTTHEATSEPTATDPWQPMATPRTAMKIKCLPGCYCPPQKADSGNSTG